MRGGFERGLAPGRRGPSVGVTRVAAAPLRRLRRRWLPPSKLRPHVDHTGRNRRFGNHGLGHRRGGSGDRARGGLAQPESGGRRRHAGQPEQVAGQAGREGQAHRSRSGRYLGTGAAHHPSGRARRRRPRHRVRRRGPGGQAGPLPRARQRLQARHDPGHEHLDAACDRDGNGHRPSRPGVRCPLLQSRTGHVPGRGRATDHGERRHHRRRSRRSPPRVARSRSRSRTRPGSSSTPCSSPT